jgi:hypothetical protein
MFRNIEIPKLIEVLNGTLSSLHITDGIIEVMLTNDDGRLKEFEVQISDEGCVIEEIKRLDAVVIYSNK